MKRKIGLLTPGVKLGPRQLFDMLADTGRGLLDIAVITGLAEVVIGILSLTSLEFSLTFTLLTSLKRVLFYCWFSRCPKYGSWPKLANACCLHPSRRACGPGSDAGRHCAHRGASVHFCFIAGFAADRSLV